MSTYMPLLTFSRASSTLSHSWSVETPAAMYAFSGLPDTPGAWPSITGRTSSLASTSGSQPTTPGKFIISPSPNSPQESAMRFTSAAPSTQPE